MRTGSSGTGLLRGRPRPGYRSSRRTALGRAPAASGPTLELFQYSPPGAPSERSIHRPGFGHIAFSLSDVKAARAEVLARGGSAIGEVVKLSLPTGEEVDWCYVADPEGNGIELQTWL